MCKDLSVGSDREGVCTASPNPDPGCAGRSGYVCADSTTLLSCAFGYASRRTSCSGTCVTSITGQDTCAITADDPRCAQIDVGYACDGTTLLECNNHALIAQTTCATACDQPAPGDAFCSSSSTPDPRCSAGMVAWCDGDTAYGCQTGNYVSVDTCMADGPCYVATLPDGTVLNAFCNARGTGGTCPSS